MYTQDRYKCFLSGMVMSSFISLGAGCCTMVTELQETSSTIRWSVMMALRLQNKDKTNVIR